MRSYLVAFLAVASVSSMLESTFDNAVWSQKQCGVPEAVHFLPSRRLLFVDARGYCLLNPDTNEVERQRTDDIDQTALTADGTLLTLSRANKRAQFVNPLTDNLVKDLGVSVEAGGQAFVAPGGLYVARGPQISLLTADKTDPKTITLEAVGVMKLKADPADPKMLEVWAETSSESGLQLCSYSVAADLSVATRKNCHKRLSITPVPAQLTDLFVDGSGELVQLTATHVQVGDAKEELGPQHDLRSSLGVTRRLWKSAGESCVEKIGSKLSRVCLKGSTHLHLTFLTPHRTLDVTVAFPKDDSVSDYWLGPDGLTLVVATRLDLVSIIDLERGSEVLRRDESLAHVTEVSFVHKKLDAEKLAYLRTYEGRLRSKNVVGAWSARVAYSLKSLAELLAAGKASLGGFLDGIRRGDLKGAMGSLLDVGLGEGSRRTLAHAPKVALLFTRSGKIWAYDLEHFALGSHTFLDVSVKARHEGSVDLTASSVQPDCWVSHLDRFELLIDCRHTPRLSNAVVINADLEMRAHTLLDAQGIPPIAFRLSADRTHLAGTVDGAEAWRVSIPKTETLLRIDRIQDFKVPLAAFQIENANVLYKLVDPNNALVTSREDGRLHVRVVNLRFGKVLASFVTEKADLSLGVQTLVDDNAFFVSYFNAETLTQELLAVELFRKRVENDFVRILKAEFGAKERTLPDINYSAADPEYVVLHRRFGLPVHVRRMKAFDSNVDLTSKNLVVVSESDQIYSVPRTAVSARRATPAERTKAEEQLARSNKAKIDVIHYFRSLTLEPYAYFLPAVPANFVTKDQRVSGIREVWMEPTSFESTSFLVATGRDLWVTVHSPNGAYDQLPDDFNKPLLWVFLVAFIVLIAVTGRLARRKVPRQRFLQYIGG